jgi:outer membrane protein assembly factor BamB
MFRLLALSALLALPPVACTVNSAHADNWGHWRGVDGNGVANANPPVRFSSGENLRWKVAIPGRGSGSPVVWEDRVFVVTAVPAQGGPRGQLAFQTLCLSRDDGKLLWKKTAVEAVPHEGTHATNGYASASPCTDGKHVYSHFGSRGLYCYTMDGDLVWSRDDFGRMRTRMEFGEGSSPTLVGDMLLVPWDHEGPSALYALDKATGKTLWKADRDEPTGWATPLVIDAPRGKQVVMNGQNYARAYDLKTGKELWRCAGQTARPVASAVSGDGLVFVGSGFRGAFLGAFRPDGRGDIAGSSHVAWTVNRDTPDIASPLLSDGRLYFFKEKSGLLTCLDAATGKPHYSARRIPGLRSTYASPIAAGGFVYLTDRNGTITVIKDSAELEVVETNSVGEGVDATPAAVDNQLFVRGERTLFCFQQ